MTRAAAGRGARRRRACGAAARPRPRPAPAWPSRSAVMLPPRGTFYNQQPSVYLLIVWRMQWRCGIWRMRLFDVCNSALLHALCQAGCCVRCNYTQQATQRGPSLAIWRMRVGLSGRQRCLRTLCLGPEQSSKIRIAYVLQVEQCLRIQLVLHSRCRPNHSGPVAPRRAGRSFMSSGAMYGPAHHFPAAREAEAIRSATGPPPSKLRGLIAALRALRRLRCRAFAAASHVPPARSRARWGTHASRRGLPAEAFPQSPAAPRDCSPAERLQLRVALFKARRAPDARDACVSYISPSHCGTWHAVGHNVPGTIRTPCCTGTSE